MILEVRHQQAKENRSPNKVYRLLLADFGAIGHTIFRYEQHSGSQYSSASRWGQRLLSNLTENGGHHIDHNNGLAHCFLTTRSRVELLQRLPA